MAEALKIKIDPAVGLLTVAAFLGPLLGGQVSLDAQPSAGVTLASLMNGPENPILSHFLVACPAVIAFVWLFARRKVVQVPGNAATSLTLSLLALISLSVVMSHFRTSTVTVVAEFLLSGVAMFAVVAGAGRRVGPRTILHGLAAGASIVALRGLQEYFAVARSNPSWRIFGSWVQPNALAAMGLIAFFVIVGLWLDAERLERFALGAGAIVMASAIYLTGSKGGLLCWLASVVAFVVLIGPARRRSSLMILAGCLLAMIALMGLQKSIGGAAGNRMGSVAQETEQSAGFRSNLWRGIPAIVRENQMGTGMGTYRFYSATSGLTTQTKYAHQTYLQLAVEASPLAPLVLFSLLGYWAWQIGRLRRTSDPKSDALRVSVVCAVFAVGLHGMIDSDLYYFGVQWSVFILLGIGWLLAGDAVAPEYLPAWARLSFCGFAIATWFAYGYLTTLESAKGKLAFATASKDRRSAEEAAGGAMAFADIDGEIDKLLLQTGLFPDRALVYADRMVDLAPSVSNLRLAARLNMAQGRLTQAQTLLNRALKLDPNNPSTLSRLAAVYEQEGLEADRRATLKRLIEVEETPYFKVRSLPQFVPTETYLARITMAESAKAPDEKVDLLAPAVAGFAQYRDRTVPEVRTYVTAGMPSPEGDDLQVVAEKLESAHKAALDLAAAYRALGKAAEAGEAAEEAERFAGLASEILKK